MASKLTTPSVLKTATRKYAAAAATATKSAGSAEGLQVSKLPSGAVVASLENNSPLARVAVFLRGGARFNTFPGASQTLRLCASGGLSSSQRTGFNMIRVSEQMGASINVCAGRETACYGIASSRDSVDESLSLLSSLTSNNTYRYYEFPSKTSIDHIKANQVVSPLEIASDLVLKAAFRQQSLGNSLLIPDYQMGRLNAEDLNNFVQATHGPSGLVVVGTGIDHQVLAAGAAAFGVAGGSTASTSGAAKYIGGDLRVETGGNSTSVVVAGEGGKLGSAEGLACAVAAELLASGPVVKYGGNSSSVLAKALKDAASAGVSTVGVNESFSDTGLLGFSLTAPAAVAPKIVSTLVSAVKNASANDKEVAGAKARVKAALLESASGCSEIGAIGSQLLLTGSYVDAVDACRAVDAVSNAAVTKALAKAFSGKLSVAAVGNVNDVPYADTL